MDLIVRKSKDTMEKLGNHGMSFYTSGQLFLEEYYTLGSHYSSLGSN
jgi:ferredoxin-nitrate reductase